MKKFIFAILIAVAFAATLLVGGCDGGQATVEYTLSEDGTYYIVSGVSGNKLALKEYDIPAVYAAEEGEEPKPVKTIGVKAFCQCSALRRVTIPDSVTVIGGMAFADCAFTEIVIPPSVTLIGNEAFFLCESLSEIIIPSSVTQLGHSAFKNCSALQRVVVNAEITTLYGYTFYNSWAQTGGSYYFSSRIKEIYLPKTLKKVNVSALEGNVYMGDVHFAGTQEEWNEITLYAQQPIEGKEGEYEEQPVDRSRVFAANVNFHFNSVYTAQ